MNTLPLVLSPNSWMWKPCLPGVKPVKEASTTTLASSEAWENLTTPEMLLPLRTAIALTILNVFISI